MLKIFYRSLIVTFFLGLVTGVYGEGIEITQAGSILEDDIYLLNANLEFDIKSEALGALEHGVGINIDLLILIKRERNWLWDPKVKEEILSFRLEQHPLSNRYIVTDSGSGDRRQFQSLVDALKYLGTIRNHFLISQKVLQEGENYICMIKAELNTEKLPAAIRPATFLSKKWQLDSPWFSWSLIQ